MFIAGNRIIRHVGISVTRYCYIPGGHDNAYMSTLSSLAKEELLGKLVFLQGYNELSAEMLQMALPSIQVDGLFLSEKPPSVPRRSGAPGPLAFPSATGSITTNGGLISPQSETYSITGHIHRAGTSGKPIDPTKVRRSHVIVSVTYTDFSVDIGSLCTSVSYRL